MNHHLPCSPTPATCSVYRPGHLMHWIHAGLIGRTPTQWRRATVVAVHGCDVTVAYRGGHEVSLWHHRAIELAVSLGQEVRLHEQFSALSVGASIYNVAVEGGLGPVSDDEVGDGYLPSFVAVADLSTGNGAGGSVEPQD